MIDIEKPKVDILDIKTKRGTSFGRAHTRYNFGNEQREIMFFISDFELKVMKTNYKSTQRVLFALDKIENTELSTLLTIYMHDQSVKYYIPIGHCLLKTPDTETFQA